MDERSFPFFDLTDTRAIGDYKSSTQLRGIPAYTSVKLQRIRRWLKRLTSSSRVSDLLKLYPRLTAIVLLQNFLSRACAVKQYAVKLYRQQHIDKKKWHKVLEYFFIIFYSILSYYDHLPWYTELNETKERLNQTFFRATLPLNTNTISNKGKSFHKTFLLNPTQGFSHLLPWIFPK